MALMEGLVWSGANTQDTVRDSEAGGPREGNDGKVRRLRQPA
jgi:hypothetical protein